MVEWKLRCTEQQVESLCDALEELQALSASVEDADADTASERAIFGEPGMPMTQAAWQHSTVSALFADETQAQIARAALGQRCLEQAWVDLGLSAVPDLDWVSLTQSQFAPVAITPEFWIVPSWHAHPPEAKLVMQLDPGMAFGTGTHPTTRMCLQWLTGPKFGKAPQHPQERCTRVLDYGCGSGVLAIAAGLLAQKIGLDVQIDAVDLDPAAVQATAQNARTNGVALSTMPVEGAQGEYQIVLANILATPLKVLAPLLCSHLAPGGFLVLAGILERQAEELTQAYRQWVDLSVADTQEGWVLMTAQRNTTHP